MQTNQTQKPNELQDALKPSRKLFGLVILLSVVSNVLLLTGPLFMLLVYDRVLTSGSEETLLALFILVASLYLLMWLIEFSRGSILRRIAARFQCNLDGRIFGTSIRAIALGKTNSTNGARDVEGINNFVSSSAILALLDLPWTPLFFLLIFGFHQNLGWLAIAGTSILIVVTIANQLLTQHKTSDSHKTSSEAEKFSNQIKQAGELVSSQGMLTDVIQRWNEMRTNALEMKVGSNDWSGIFTSFTKSFRLFLQSAMLALGAYLTLEGQLTAGAMIAGSILLGRALAPVEQTLGQWQIVQRAHTSWSSLKSLLKAIPEPKRRIELPRPEAFFQLSNVSVLSKPGKPPILNQISFAIEPGEVIGVIGDSGAGKTTLAKALLGIAKPQSGELRLGGAAYDQFDPEVLGKYIGYLPQEITLFSGTIAENIARMAVNVDDKAVIKAAKKANAHEMIEGLEGGYNAVIDPQRIQLSGGERQRIALARALYGDPLALVLDEPNSALDDKGSVALNRAIRTFRSNQKSVIIMTHRPMAIAECTRLVVMEHGRIQAIGPREEVINSIVERSGDVQRIQPKELRK